MVSIAANLQEILALLRNMRVSQARQCVRGMRHAGACGDDLRKRSWLYPLL
jgi:hypothetical protein